MSTKVIEQHTLPLLRAASDLVPMDKESQRILQERADFLASSNLNIEDNKKNVSYIKFMLGEREWYGIPYHYTKEVIRNVTPTQIPFVPPYIVGVINRHGALIAVFDLKQRLNLLSSTNDNTHIIIVTLQNTTVGFLVDYIEGSDSYDPSALDNLSSGWMEKSEYFIGLHQGIVAILNIEVLLSDIQIN